MIAQALRASATPPSSRPLPKVGERIAIRYKSDMSLFCERVVLCQIEQGATFLLLSPDHEILEEDIGGSGDVEGWYPLAGSTPAGVSTNDFYRFADVHGRPPNALEVASWIREANDLAASLLTGRGAGGVGQPAAVAPGGGGPAAPSAPGLVAASLAGWPAVPPWPSLGFGGEGDKLPAEHRIAAGQGLVGQALAAAGATGSGADWVVAVAGGGLLAGEAVPAGCRIVAGSVRGIAVLRDGAEVFIERTSEKRVFFPVPRPGLTERAVAEMATRLDPRCFSLGLDLAGRRHTDFKMALDKLTGNIEKFSQAIVSGPATFVWLMRHMYDNGGSPTAFHLRWVAEIRLDYSAAGLSDHQCWCKVFETFLCYDGGDGSQFVAMELRARRVQMHHGRWRHKMPGLAGGAAASGGGADDDVHLLMGTHETRGNVGVCPALTRWMGEELAKEALAAKERRKAREERALAAPKK